MSSFFQALIEMIKTQDFGVIHIAAQKGDGEIETHSFFPANPCQNTYSVAKTFAMTAIGLLYDRGLLSLNERIVDIFEDEIPEGIDPRIALITVEHLLLHRAGFEGGFLDIDCVPSTEFGEDFLQYLLRTPLVYTPNTESRYSDAAYYLLSRIVTKKAGMSADDFLWRELLFKVGCTEMAWSHCPKGHAIGATGMYIRAEDMVKLGMIYRDGGLFRGERILSEQWCRMAIEKSFALDRDADYKIYCKGGMYGQELIVFPEADRVVAIQSFSTNSATIAEWVKKNGLILP